MMSSLKIELREVWDGLFMLFSARFSSKTAHFADKRFSKRVGSRAPLQLWQRTFLDIRPAQTHENPWLHVVIGHIRISMG